MEAPASPRILIVEDSPLARHVTALALRAAGYRVEGASSLKDAELALLREDADLCLLDLILPDSVGLKSWSRLHQAAPTTPVVVLTGDPDFAELMQARTPVLTKPVTTHLLVSTVQAVLSGRPPPTPAAS